MGNPFQQKQQAPQQQQGTIDTSSIARSLGLLGGGGGGGAGGAGIDPAQANAQSMYNFGSGLHGLWNRFYGPTGSGEAGRESFGTPGMGLDNGDSGGET